MREDEMERLVVVVVGGGGVGEKLGGEVCGGRGPALLI